MKILILCTGNSCRSQMAHGFLQSFDKDIQVYSAGTHPAEKVNPLAVEAMAEVGIDISRHIPTNVTAYLSDTWDYVITVCGSADEMCPAFEGNVGKRLPVRITHYLNRSSCGSISLKTVRPLTRRCTSNCSRMATPF